MPETAQEAYAAMLRDELAPELRRLGFKGSGGRYELPYAAGWATLGFQKSQWSDAASVSFTVNLSVIARDAWERVQLDRDYPVKPAANTMYGVGWQRRIGRVMPEDADLWWNAEADAPTAPVAAEVVRAVEQFALPALRERMTDATG